MNNIPKTLFLVGLGLWVVLATYTTARSGQAPKDSQPAAKNLKEAVDKALLGSEGTYALAIKNLKTGELYYLNEHKSFEAGSLYKLWVLVAAFNAVEKGTLAEDEVLSESVAILNNTFGVAPDGAELTEGTVTLTVTQALEQMITISHNYAAYLLVEKIGNPAIRAFLTAHGFTESSLNNPPQTTPADLALFFEKLYQNQLANPESTEKMISILKRQTLNNKLPRYLPENTAVAHKTGEIDYLTHDAGIVYTDKGDYVIVVLSESDLPAGAEERIAEVSKNVYDYFTHKG